MNMTDKKVYEGEIRIYQSPWKTTLLSVLCLPFVVVGCLMIMDNDGSVGQKILVGWLNVIFFGVCGLSVLMVNIYNKIRHIPLLIIYEDKLEFYVQFRGTYYTINFADVERFRMTRIFGSKQIAIDYKTSPLANKYEKSSSFRQWFLKFNLNVLGAIESIPAEGLTMRGKDICDILNERLSGIT